MEQVPQLLLVDGDPVLCRTLAEYLHGHGFSVTVKYDGETGLHHAMEDAYDLVILDVMLPELSGIEVLRRIRQQGELPVVMLAASSDDVERIVGLELGADDYLSKSCNLRELVARLHSILRRTRRQMAIERKSGNDTAGLSIFPAERRATWRGKPLQLTSTEFNLLEALFNYSGHAVSKAELAISVLGREIGQYDRSLDMHISNLRKKLGKLGDGRSPIQTVTGAGYQLIHK
ncbi:MAG: response regulator transcription factor [Sulfuritalea sp.]|nr:response regulator transcription factor [Sulfuritalea sp.]